MATQYITTTYVLSRLSSVEKRQLTTEEDYLQTVLDSVESEIIIRYLRKQFAVLPDTLPEVFIEHMFSFVRYKLHLASANENLSIHEKVKETYMNALMFFQEFADGRIKLEEFGLFDMSSFVMKKNMDDKML